jgi:hypothetical protein
LLTAQKEDNVAKSTDFPKCPYYNKQPCPGLSYGNEARSSKTVVTTEDGKVFVDFFDFIRDHEYKCSECPINKPK